jgi:hypothetical protein
MKVGGGLNSDLPSAVGFQVEGTRKVSTTQHETHTVNTVQSTANDLSRFVMGSGRSLFQYLPMKHFSIDTFHCAARSESLQCAVRFPVGPLLTRLKIAAIVAYRQRHRRLQQCEGPAFSTGYQQNDDDEG